MRQSLCHVWQQDGDVKIKQEEAKQNEREFRLSALTFEMPV